jgi:hypothetical protein
MRHIYRLLMLAVLLFPSGAYALDLFLDAIYWRATETNDWCYVNSLQLPNQTIDYKTIDFGYAPGFRVGAVYVSTWDALLAYTRLYTTANESATGNIRPSFSGSVTASPTGYLFQSGQVNQSIDYNIFDLDFGKQFHPAESLMLHPIVGLMGGWINQSIHATFRGSTSTSENISNNFSGLGPKFGIDTSIDLFNYNNYQPKLIAAFAASYLLGHWDISDFTRVTPVSSTATVYVNGNSHNLGATTLQGSIGVKLDHKNLSVKLAYEISDWLNQSQLFDNDTGTHNNDLILQGLTLGVTYKLA